MSLDQLRTALSARIETAGLADKIELKDVVLAGVPRLSATRRLAVESRYLRIARVDTPGASWDYEVLGGQYGSADPEDDFDGRRGGDLNAVLELFDSWLVRLMPWE